MTGILSPTFWCLYVSPSELSRLHHQCRQAGTSRLGSLSSILAMIHIQVVFLPKKGKSGPFTQKEAPNTAYRTVLFGFFG